MKKIILVLTFLACGFLPVCAREITVSVEGGSYWKEKPQFAVWLEDLQGNYISTLYVTKKASKKSWYFSPKEGRPESLPVWYNASSSALKNEKLPAQKSSAVDAVTSATPKGGANFKSSITDKNCVIKAEFNISFDYNDFYTKKNSGVNGQPSVVYSAELPENQIEEIILLFEGSGSLNGSDGKINSNVQNLTTAKEIVKFITVKFI